MKVKLQRYVAVISLGAACNPSKNTDAVLDTVDESAEADVDADTDTDTDTDTALPEKECMYVPAGEQGDPGTSTVVVEVVASGLETPWGMDWLPGGDLLITEREGRISRVDPESGAVTVLAEVPSVEVGEGGLLGLAIHPDFTENSWFYVYYTINRGGGPENRVARWTLSGDGLSATEDAVVVEGIPARQYHNGGRLRFGPDGMLYIGTGDAGEPVLSQDVTSLAGKILRVDDAGAAPSDNPVAGERAWIWGIRNTQGFDWREDGRILVTDHGPSGLSNEGGRSGHDEVTLAEAGDNLGWPDVYACEEGAGFVQPAITWETASPPGGAAVYTGSALPEWQGDLLVGVMGIDEETPRLQRLRLDKVGNVTINEVYLSREYGRLRDVRMGPDGRLYITTSNCDGRGECGEGDRILRL